MDISGAFGDLGTTLPLAFAIAHFCHYPLDRIFLPWGIAYILTAVYYRIPVSIQPLKAMTVIAISMSASQELISTAAILYGILFILLSLSGAIRFLQRFFPSSIIRGVQLGIGLLLAAKALELLRSSEILLGVPVSQTSLLFLLSAGFLSVLWFFQLHRSIPIAPLIILISIAASMILGITPSLPPFAEETSWIRTPVWSLAFDALTLLIIPQLPLTIGNSVFAASDVCCTVWPHAGKKATPTKLAFSIGTLNIGIGTFGGFPICHGAGGIAAHAQLGARTGFATAFIGLILVLSALISPFQQFLFYIPIPLLSALLFLDAGRMIWFLTLLQTQEEKIVAFSVGFLALLLSNLTIAVIAGLLLRLCLSLVPRKESVSK